MNIGSGSIASHAGSSTTPSTSISPVNLGIGTGTADRRAALSVSEPPACAESPGAASRKTGTIHAHGAASR